MINLLEAFKNETRSTKKSLGQHFLTNMHILQELADATCAAGGKNIIEIGPGCGVLTQLLVETGANVKAVDIDTELTEFLKRYLFFHKNLEVINKDALETNFEEIFPNEPVTFAGNLPYNLSVRIFERAASRANIERMIFMFQKEVADRIASKPNSKSYSSLSVFTSYMFDVKKIRDISGGNFWPNANVMSTVLCFTPKKERTLTREEETAFFGFLRTAFTQKRKTLKNNLRSINDIDDILLSVGLTVKSRAEELPLEKFIELFRRCNVG